LYHSTLGLRVIKKMKKVVFTPKLTDRTVEFAGFVGSKFERNVTKFEPQKVPKLIA